MLQLHLCLYENNKKKIECQISHIPTPVLTDSPYGMVRPTATEVEG